MIPIGLILSYFCHFHQSSSNIFASGSTICPSRMAFISATTYKYSKRSSPGRSHRYFFRTASK